MNVTDKTFVAAVRKRAAEAPGFVYPRPLVWSRDEQDYVEISDCLYVEVDPETKKLRGSCLLGCGLVDLGVDPELLVFENTATTLMTALRLLGVNLSHVVVRWANTAQGAQDLGETWSASIALADKKYPLEGIE